MKFSIIVPVYNVELYLEECLNSIVNQSYLDLYEVILINDGSSDNSRAICEKYIDQYNFIKLINQENKGLSCARNTGIKLAVGEYLVFVDSDDIIEKDTLKFFNDTLQINQVDVMITKIKKVNYHEQSTKFMDTNLPVKKLNKANKSEVLNYMFTKSKGLWPAVRYIVKKDFIYSNNLSFLEGYYHEDIDWTTKLLIKAESFVFLDYYWYNHRLERTGSITNNISSKRTLDVINIAYINLTYLDSHRIDGVHKKIVMARLVLSLFILIKMVPQYSMVDRLEIINELNKKRELFKFTIKFKHRIFLLLTKLIGFNNTFKLLKIFSIDSR